MIKKYKFQILSISIITALLIFYFVSPQYVRKALIHQKADIDDYTIFENRTVEAGTYQPWAIADDFNKNEISEKHLSEFEKLKTIAFLVIQNKKIKYEKYWGNYDSDAISNSFSMSKSIISMLIGIAIDEGKIKSVNQTVEDFIPEYNTENNKNLTIKDLLTMSSGLDWCESYGNLYSETSKAYYGNNLKNLVCNLQVIEETGKQFKYLSGNTQLLSFILKNATGKNISEYTSEKIWKKIGAKNDALWSLDKKDGDEKSYCCFNSNARDFARIGQLILNKGKWGETQIVPEAYLEEALKPAEYLKDNSGESVDFYGYQFWIINYKNLKINYARGILGQYIMIIPEKNAVIVRLGEKRVKKKKNHHPVDAYLYIDAALEILEN